MTLLNTIEAELSTSVGTGDAPYSDDEMRRMAELKASPEYKRYCRDWGIEMASLKKPEFRGF